MPFLNPDHRPAIKHPQGHPVSVIVAFNTQGDIRPRYFSIEDDNQEIFKYQISSVIAVKEKHLVTEYYCTYVENVFTRDIVLCFDITQCRWVIG